MQWSWSTLKKIIYNHLLLDFFKYKYVLLVLRSIMCISLKITSILKVASSFVKHNTGLFHCLVPAPCYILPPMPILIMEKYWYMYMDMQSTSINIVEYFLWSAPCKKKTPGRKLNVVWCSCTNSNYMKFSIHLSPENKQNYITI